MNIHIKAAPVTNPDSNEWYTHPDVIEAARRTMGVIDLDPFSCAQANEVVQAKAYYSKEPKHRCAYLNEWAGNTYMNPPYSRGQIDRAVKHFLGFLEAGTIPFAVTLTPLSDAGWYHDLLDKAAAFCLPRGRFRHWGPLAKEGESQAGRRPQCVMYFEGEPSPWGIGKQAFAAEFSRFGRVIKL